MLYRKLLADVLHVTKSADEMCYPLPERENAISHLRLSSPSVFSASFLPTRLNGEGFNEVRMSMPPHCCFCGREARTFLPIVVSSSLLSLRLRIAGWQPWLVPHCIEHGNSRTSRIALMQFDRYSEIFVISIWGRSLEFLQSLVDLNAPRELEPPWVVFPRPDPGSGYTQGITEGWWYVAWSPFWNRMNAVERAAYLARWPPPPGIWSEDTLTDLSR